MPANAPTTESTTESPTTTASATTTDTDEPEAKSSTTTTMETPTEVAPLRELVDNFRKFDKNGDDQWDFDEYVDFLADGMHIPDENRNRLEQSRIFRGVFEIFDQNGDNELSMDEIWEKGKWTLGIVTGQRGKENS
jgi:Ca2+-binding EF-hand superfamily protein